MSWGKILLLFVQMANLQNLIKSSYELRKIGKRCERIIHRRNKHDAQLRSLVKKTETDGAE